jgi:hypothetical protein
MLISESDFPTQFPTELLTTGWEMVAQNGQLLGKKAIFFKTKRNWMIQDKIGRKGLGNRCSIQLSYGTDIEISSLFGTA